MKLSRRDWLRYGAVAGAGVGLLPGVAEAAGAAGQASGAHSASPAQKWGAAGSDPGQTLPPEATNGPWRNLRAVKEKKVFDSHCHSWGLAPGNNEPVDNTNKLITAMDLHGIAQAVLVPSRMPYETVVANDVVPHLDRFVRASGLPTNESKGKELTPQIVAEIYKTHLQRDGCVIIGQTSADAWTTLLRHKKYAAKDLKPMADVVMEYDVPVQMTTGWSATDPRAGSGRDYQTAWHWAEEMGALLAEYPDIKFILVHAGGPLDGQDAVRLAFSFENAYVDTSKALPEIVSELVRGIGAERVLFGSDWNQPQMMDYGPFYMRAAQQQWWNLNTIANADLTEDQRDWILYKSARKLLKLRPA